jgi:predicted MFS family arabinose efflux permease
LDPDQISNAVLDFSLMSINVPQTSYAHPARLIIVLAIAPAIGLGICRFAYALVLPDMLESLGWSYSIAGLMNTINAAGYLAGALGANAVIRRLGLFNSVRISAAACVLSLFASALTGQVVIFSIARLISGIAAAFAFIAGGALASNVAQAQPQRQAFYLSLFYIGPAAGILVSGIVSPFLLGWFGAGSWWIVWTALAAISSLAALALPLARVAEPSMPAGAAGSVSIRSLAIYLVGYALFGASYIAYMTFMVAYVRNVGGGELAQSAFWTCIGVGAFAQPWVWSRLMAKARSGRVTALLIAITAAGALIPLMGTSLYVLATSALVFGNAFFAVVSSTSAFARLIFPPPAWPKAIAVMTVSFGVGQTLGPIAIGAITDAMGNLSYALNVSAAVLLAGVAACLAYAALRRQADQPKPTARLYPTQTAGRV